MKPWEVLENLNAYVYVSDYETYEVVYLNKKIRDQLGDVGHGKCYEVLKRCASPCKICRNGQLSEGEFDEWSSFDPDVRRRFFVKDTLIRDEGRLLHLAISFDSGMDPIRKYNTDAMAEVVNEGLRLSLADPDPDQSIEILLEYLGKALHGKRSFVYEKNKSGCTDNTYEWTAAGVAPIKDRLQNIPPHICANWYRNFRENKNIIVADIDDIEDSDPIHYANLSQHGIRSLAVIPLYENNEPIGFFGVDNPPAESLIYSEELLRIMHHFMVSALKRRDLVRRLEVMSYEDQLTGLGNRHAMKGYMHSVMPGMDRYGVIFCDITRLKWVNDNLGHDAGDAYIRRACGCLKEALDTKELFRIGGDELVAILPGATREKLEEQVEALRRALKAAEVTMAIGAVCSEEWIADSENRDLGLENGDVNFEGGVGFQKVNPENDIDAQKVNPENRGGVQKVIAEAEKRMYEDKAAYYKKTGIDRRR